MILEAADKGELSRTREELKLHLREQIPWYDLIERIRIHDSHRFGLMPPGPRFTFVMVAQPVKLRAQDGDAIYRVPASGLEKLTTGTSDIQEQRPLLSRNGASSSTMRAVNTCPLATSFGISFFLLSRQ